MFFQSIIITAILLSYSIRTPIYESCPLDYEIRTGIDLKIKESKYDIKMSARLLYERESTEVIYYVPENIDTVSMQAMPT
jgi:hypothetical protein